MDQSPVHNLPLEAQANGQVQNELDEIINPSQILEDENLNNINPFPTFEDKQEPIKRLKIEEETAKKDQKLVDPNLNIKPASIFQFYKYIPLKHKILLIIATTLALIQSLALPVYTIVIGRIALQLDPTFTTQEIYDNVCLLAIVLGIAAGASFFITLIFLSLFMHIGENVGYIYRTKFLEAILTQDMKWYDKQQIASFPTKIQELSSQIQTAAGDKLGQCIHDCTMPLFSLAVSFYMFWQLSLVLLGAYPFLLLSSIIFTRSIQNRAKSKARSQECISSQAEEVLLGIKTVIAFNGQEQEEKLFNEAARDVKNQGIKDQNHFAIGSGIYFFFMFCFYSFTIYIGSLFILEDLKDPKGDKYEADAIFTVLFSFVFSTFNLSRALPNLKYVFEAKVALAKINQVISNERSIDYQSGEPVTSCSGNIEFRNIYFNYPSKPDIPVLKDISFQIQSGQKIAVCGESGSGKSTIIQLLQRFYDPDQGAILIDGRDIRTINFSQMRKFISIVSQEPVLFNTSIRDNIRFSKPDASQTEIENAAKLANAHNFIVDKLSDGYETQVGSGGSLLSGGEKQRIAIARAVLKDLKILILDEATSALDQNNEKEVQSSLDQISSQISFTSIIIAHRISTIRNADTIYVLSKGELKEYGTHDQLLEKKNIYAALVEAQKLQEKKDSEKLSKKDIMSEKASTYKQLSQYQDRETQSKNEDKKHEFNFDTVIITEDKELIDKNQKDIKENEENQQQQSQGKKKKPKVINSQIMRRLGKINKQKIWLIPTGVLAALVNGVVFPTFSIVLVEAMARISIPFRDKFREETQEVALYFLIFAVVKFISFMVQSLCLGYFSEYLTEKLRIITFKKLLYHDVQEFDKKPPSVMSNTLANETILINSAAGTTLPWFTEGICSLFGGLIVSLIYSWAIGLVFIGFAPLMVISSVLMMKQIKGFAQSSGKKYEPAALIASDSIINIKTVRSFGNERYIIQQFDNSLQDALATGKKVAISAGFSMGFSRLLIFGLLSLLFWFSAWLINHNDWFTFLDCLTSMFSAIYGAFGAGHSSIFASDIGAGESAAINIFNILDNKNQIVVKPEKNSSNKKVQNAQIEFKNVYFSYPKRENVQVLKNFNLIVQVGTTAGLVGFSGSGKSTIIQLLLRFYDPTSGEILIDGVNLQAIDLIELRNMIGLVSQEPVLFTGTVKDNIKYARPEAADIDIFKAMETALVFDIKAEDQVGLKGSQISGGQKQRVAIARALIKNPKILLLDEATSALDKQSEQLVQQALDRARAERTCIAIAHRLSTIADSQQIVVLNQGEIIEKGTHQELLNINNGLYKALVQVS